MPQTMTRTGAPISEEQRGLLARLCRQGLTTLEKLKEDDVFKMNRSDLARYLDANVLGHGADAAFQTEIDKALEEEPEAVGRGRETVTA